MTSYPTRSSVTRIGAIIALVMRVEQRHWCASRNVTSTKRKVFFLISA
jgi:hypothetical protein